MVSPWSTWSVYQGIKTVLSATSNRREPSGEHLEGLESGTGARVFTGRNQRRCLPEVTMQPVTTDKPDIQ